MTSAREKNLRALHTVRSARIRMCAPVYERVMEFDCTAFYDERRRTQISSLLTINK